MFEREHVRDSMRANYSKPIARKPLFFIALILGACSFSGATVTRDQMNSHASALTKLTAAMESHIRYGSPRPGASEQELFAEGTKSQASLLEQFSEFKLKVHSQDNHALVLVCTKNGDRALLEDAGCTGKMDAHHWEKSDVPCNFTVSIPQVCGEQNRVE